MSLEVKIPEMGESISEGVLLQWLAQDGAVVQVDEPLFELETDKVNLTINAEDVGRLKTLASAGDKVQVGQVVGEIDTADAGQSDEDGSKPAIEPESGTADDEPTADSDSDPDETPARSERKTRLSPAVRKLVAEENLDPGQIEGSGRKGRITRKDVVAFLESREEASTPSQPDETEEKEPSPPPSEVPAGRKVSRRSMSSLRRTIADRLVQSQRETATLTTFNEADLSAVLDWRHRHGERFREEHGVKLGFMPFFVKAAVNALQAVPRLNSRIDGDEIVENHFFDIGVAVATDRGLVVPVIRDADRLTFAEVEEAVADLARRAVDKTLQLDELTGGCFTISNGGVYGNLLSTPILNPPQSGILGMHAIKKRPVAVEDRVEIRPMMYVALSYDHRLVDGREAVTFLKRIVEQIEAPERMLLGL